ncbi:hypothetical protein C8R43DRAFT_1000514 [Mycena crocata]|nr:hypothetical protein C8R43DRAFT_1000514 [Mycena crocata]
MSAGIPETKSGRLVCIARLKIAPGHESLFEELIAAARDYALSAEEPGTYTYRIIRIIDEAGKSTGEYVIFEEYADTAGFLAHGASPPIKALLEKKDLATEMMLQYAEEF